MRAGLLTLLTLLMIATTAHAADQCASVFRRPTLRERFIERARAMFAAKPAVVAKYNTIPPRKGMRESDLKSRVSYISREILPRYEIQLESQTWKYKNNRPLIDGMYYYHMDSAGRFFIMPVADEYTTARLQHSSLPSGGQTAGVGFMTFKNQKLVSVDHYSGHYQPPVEIFNQVLNELTERGQDMSAVIIGGY